MASRKKNSGDDPHDDASSSSSAGGMNRPFAEPLRDFKIRRPPRPKSKAKSAPSSKAPPSPAAPVAATQPPSEGDGRAEPAAADPEAPGGLGWESYAYEDRAAYLQAYADVRPLASGPKMSSPSSTVVETPSEQADDEARARLAHLLSRGLRFRVVIDDDGFLEGYREGASKAVRAALGRKGAAESTLDLHGYRRDEARQRLVEFIRSERRAGCRVVRVIHGKGRHSEGGTGVLADLAVETLTSEVIGFAVLALRSEFSPDHRPASLMVLLSDPVTGR